MTDSILSRSPRSFSRVDAKRAFIGLAIAIIAAVGYWLMLPAIQSLIIPSAPGGDNGPWLVRPVSVFHLGAVVVMAAVTVPLLMWPLQQMWLYEDAAMGTRFDPFHAGFAKRGLVLVKGCLLLAVGTLGLVFYLFSWTIVGPDGIQQGLPWTTLKHSYEDIVSLEMIPDGERSESIKQNGPWYSITLKSGRFITLSYENEGSTREELLAMTTYIADRSDLTWLRKSDARAR